jgi:hypothetical protein
MKVSKVAEEKISVDPTAALMVKRPSSSVFVPTDDFER